MKSVPSSHFTWFYRNKTDVSRVRNKDSWHNDFVFCFFFFCISLIPSAFLAISFANPYPADQETCWIWECWLKPQNKFKLSQHQRISKLMIKVSHSGWAFYFYGQNFLPADDWICQPSGGWLIRFRDLKQMLDTRSPVRRPAISDSIN